MREDYGQKSVKRWKLEAYGKMALAVRIWTWSDAGSPLESDFVAFISMLCQCYNV